MGSLNYKVNSLIVMALLVGIVIGTALTQQDWMVQEKIFLLERNLTNLANRVTNLEAEIAGLRGDNLEGKTVKLGYVSPTLTDLEVSRPLIEKMIVPDMNAYAASLGRNVTFEVSIKCAEGMTLRHLELVQELRAEGVDVFVGGVWSSMADMSLAYVNANGMLMLSPGSTSPLLRFEGDGLFRLHPFDADYGARLADVAWSYGVKHVCVIQQGSHRGVDRDVFLTEWASLGGALTGEVQFFEGDPRGSLVEADAQIAGAIASGTPAERIGVILISEAAMHVVFEASDLPSLIATPWFGEVDRTRSDDSGFDAPPVVVYALTPIEEANPKYSELLRRHENVTGSSYGFDAYTYDAFTVLARAILDAGRADAVSVVKAFPDVCENTYGASGWLRLNEYGDRVPPNYDILRQGFGGGHYESFRCGGLDLGADVVTWDTRALGFTPLGP